MNAPALPLEKVHELVQRLNALFQTRLTLVDFDELAPAALFALLARTLATIEGECTETSDAAECARFLEMLNYPPIKQGGPGGRQQLAEAFEAVDRAAVYPALYWALPRVRQLKKRAYVAKFLFPIDVPPQLLAHEGLGPTYGEYRSLVDEFKRAHKAVEAKRAATNADGASPAEAKAEVAALEDERRQLVASIAKMKAKVENEAGFRAVFAATSQLRTAQDEEARLADNVQKQLAALADAEERARAAGSRAQEAERTARAEPQDLVRALEREVAALRTQVNSTLPDSIAATRNQLERLHSSRGQPARTAREVDVLAAEVHQLEDYNKELTAQVDGRLDALTDQGEHKLTVAVRQAKAVGKKLTKKRLDLVKAQADRDAQSGEVDDADARLSTLEEAETGGMSRDEMRHYTARLRNLTQEYRPKKSTLDTANAEVIVLCRTQQLLEARDSHYDDLLGRIERSRGVSGLRHVQATLEKASEQAAKVDDDKAAAVNDIARMVAAITEEIKARKQELAPLIKELRDQRGEHRVVESEYEVKKKKYDIVATQLELARAGLEREVDSLQREALAEESRFHYLQHTKTVVGVELERFKQEERWGRGHGRLARDFSTYADLFEHKLQQQQQRADVLRKQKGQVEASAGPDARQRRAFLGVRQLLRVKADARKQAQLRAHGGGGGMEMEYGSADVMQFK